MNRRLLILTRHTNLTASCRHRALQYVPYLESRGWEVEHWPLMSDGYSKTLLTEGRRALWSAIGSYGSRFTRLLGTRVKSFDAVFVQAEVFPWVPFLVERTLLFDRHPGVVVDYDDAVYADYDGTILDGKIDAVMRSCREVIAGNQTLYRYAARLNPRVTQIPTVVDLGRYSPKTDYAVKPGRPFVVGWIGTAATAKHLYSCSDALKAVAQEHPIKLQCVGAPSGFKLAGVDVDCVPWTEETECSVIREFDIGIMPLTDDAIARGKCGFKLIQYMATAVPAVGERLGANAEIITDGENGLLASSTEEYIHKIRLLIQDRGLREALGRAGRARIEAEYCTQQTAPRLESVLLRACGQEHTTRTVSRRMPVPGIEESVQDASVRTVAVGIRRNADPGLRYPAPEHFYSPDEAFPEYAFPHLSPQPNPVYRMVRELFRDMCLDERHYGTAAWNPLGDWIQRGQSVFALVNFITVRRPMQSRADFAAMLTHPSVIRAVLDYLMIATGDAALVSFGNSPVQSAEMDRLMAQNGANRLREFYLRYAGRDLGPKDLRLYISQVNSLGARKSFREFDPRDEITFDLGARSLLDSLPEKAFSEFRVEDYGSDATRHFHSKGKHLYKVHRKVVESDVIFHVAKLKTHGKVALTGALKGAVGTIGRKECLAHHRHGSAQEGNDEFRRSTMLTGLYAALGERATAECSNTVRVLHKALGRVLDRILGVDIRGSWYGNDTTWRMALDINKCLIYGKGDGSIGPAPVRKICCLIDGIVSGEGDGPIHVRSRRDGVLLLARDPCFADLGAALLMGFDPNRIPLILEAFRTGELPITSAPATAAAFLLNGAPVAADDIPGKIVPPFRPPRGWAGHVEHREGESARSRKSIVEPTVRTGSVRD